MEIEKEKKILTLSSGIRVESLLVVLVRAAAPISRLAFFFVILQSGRRVWGRNNVERVILRTELKTKRKKSSISKSYDQNKFSIVFLKEHAPKRRGLIDFWCIFKKEIEIKTHMKASDKEVIYVTWCEISRGGYFQEASYEKVAKCWRFWTLTFDLK